MIIACRLRDCARIPGTWTATRNPGPGHEKAADAGQSLLLWGRTTACDPHALGVVQCGQQRPSISTAQQHNVGCRLRKHRHVPMMTAGEKQPSTPVSCSGGRPITCDPHALGGDQCGEQRRPDLKHNQNKNRTSIHLTAEDFNVKMLSKWVNLAISFDKSENELDTTQICVLRNASGGTFL